MTNDKIESMFTYHAPKNDQPARYTVLRDRCKDLAIKFNELAPDSTEKDIAMQKLSEASMWINAAIARNE